MKIEQKIIGYILLKQQMRVNTPFQTTFEMEEGNNNRWTGASDEGAYSVFKTYATGHQVSQGSRQNVEEVRNTNGQSHKRYVTEVSQISHIDTGFKKIKVNQFQKLKELRQQYQILKGLPIQDDFLKHSHTKKQEHESSQYDSRREQSESISSSSRQTNTKRKHKHNHSTTNDRNAQVWMLQKRQLQLVLNNSMRKIDELFSNQIQYKKTIHELNIQLDNKNSDDKIQNLTRTMKRNQNQYNDRIQGLKRQLQRLKGLNRQFQQRTNIVQIQLESRNQEIRKARDQKRQIEDQIRLQKDKYLSLEIEIRRLAVQKQLLQKQKNNQINRLKGLIQVPGNAISSADVKRYEQQLRNQKHKYESLLHQFQRYRQTSSSEQKQASQFKQGQEQMKLFQALINHLREESLNQNRASMDLISSMVGKLDEKNKGKGNMENSRVLDQLYNLRNQVTSLRRDKQQKSSPFINLAESVQEYQGKIKILQREIADGSITKQNLLKQYETIKSSYEYTKDQYQKLNNENIRLRQRIREIEGNSLNESQQNVRQLKRQLDQALFAVDKARQEGQFHVGLARAENQSNIKLIQQQIARLQGEKQLLRQELNKMKAYYQAKIQQKNILLQKTAAEFSTLTQTKQQAFTTYKQNNQRQFGELVRKISGMAELNERYLQQSTQLATLQREIHELRYSAKKMKSINDSVDHLWQIKETEYANIFDIVQHLKV